MFGREGGVRTRASPSERWVLYQLRYFATARQRKDSDSLRQGNSPLSDHLAAQSPQPTDVPAPHADDVHRSARGGGDGAR